MKHKEGWFSRVVSGSERLPVALPMNTNEKTETDRAPATKKCWLLFSNETNKQTLRLLTSSQRSRNWFSWKVEPSCYIFIHSFMRLFLSLKFCSRSLVKIQESVHTAQSIDNSFQNPKWIVYKRKCSISNSCKEDCLVYSWRAKGYQVSKQRNPLLLSIFQIK